MYAGRLWARILALLIIEHSIVLPSFRQSSVLEQKRLATERSWVWLMASQMIRQLCCLYFVNPVPLNKNVMPLKGPGFKYLADNLALNCAAFISSIRRPWTETLGHWEALGSITGHADDCVDLISSSDICEQKRSSVPISRSSHCFPLCSAWTSKYSLDKLLALMVDPYPVLTRPKYFKV